MNELHSAVRDGSTERTVAVLSKGMINVDEGDRLGVTALMHAASSGHSRIVRILLNKGASVAMVDVFGSTALHWTAQGGHIAVTKLLVKAGANVEAKICTGSTPLQRAAYGGHSEVVRVLIDAGANPNCRLFDGSTPLYSAALLGHVDAVKVLLRAKANPLLTYSDTSGKTHVPLDAAAKSGHVEVARELIQECGIEGCGGASGGVSALRGAAETQQVEMMELLTSAGVADAGIVRTSAGVADTGSALRAAARSGQEASVKFLLQQQERSSGGQGADYLDTLDPFGATPLVCSIQACRSSSPRITRMLMDAGADSTTAVRLLDARGAAVFFDTPLALAESSLRYKKVREKYSTESQLHSLEATRRLLLRAEAVHAVSWLWASDVPSVTHAAATAEGAGKTKAAKTPLIFMLPTLRRRAGRPRVLLASLFRHSRKP